MSTLIEAGMLTKHWKSVPIGRYVESAESGFASGARDENGVVQLRMQNVDNRGNLLWENVVRVPSSDTQTRYLLRRGDILFNNTNSTELVGKSALFEQHDEPVVYSNHFTRIRTQVEYLIPEFLSVYLIHLWQQKVFAKICHKWIGQSAIHFSNLAALDIPLPPPEDQQQIAMCLRAQFAAIEAARIAAEAQLAAINRLSAAYLREAFAGAS